MLTVFLSNLVFSIKMQTEHSKIIVSFMDFQSQSHSLGDDTSSTYLDFSLKLNVTSWANQKRYFPPDFHLLFWHFRCRGSTYSKALAPY